MHAIAGDQDLEHRYQRPRLCLNTRRYNRLSSVGEHDNIAGLEVRRRVLEEAEVVPGCVVEAVDRHWTQYRLVGGAPRPPV